VSTATRASHHPDFGDYVAARRPVLLRAAMAMTGDRDAAEDLLQTALTNTYVAWPRIRDTGAADAYVRRAMANQTTSWWRQRWRHCEVSTDQVPEPRRAPTCPVALGPGAAVPADERAYVWQLVQTLPPRQRAAVVLRYYEDLSEAEAARVLRCSIGTVKSNASRGLATLRQRVTAGRAAPATRPTSGHDRRSADAPAARRRGSSVAPARRAPARPASPRAR
jgi:RNA polymerase sigma-70 factor (sigma-E family)